MTLYVSSLHQAALNSLQETQESVYYKGQTVNCLNDCLKDNQKAVSDETIAAVMLLMFAVVSITFTLSHSTSLYGARRDANQFSTTSASLAKSMK